jgi:hypothetical protein
MRISFLYVTLALSPLAFSQTAAPTAGHEQRQAQSDAHASAVDTRGDHAMGFSHDTTTHHFRLLPDGGLIEATTNNPNNKATRDTIQAHLSHIAEMFTIGNFNVPMFIHDTLPPGVPAMKSKHGAIKYVFEPSRSGGRVRIRTADSEALNAVHQFLAFQIDDHRTGDSHAIAASK